MRRAAPGARAARHGALAGWRFVINPPTATARSRRRRAASCMACSGGSTRATAAINAYENVAGGLYVRRRCRCCTTARRSPRWSTSRARAARAAAPRLYRSWSRRRGDWALPEPYIRSLMRWSPRRSRGARHARHRRRRDEHRHDPPCRGARPRAGRRLSRLDRGQARATRLDGWVRNRRDGTVEAVFAGPPKAVDGMIEACRRGPPSARVEHRSARRRRRRAGAARRRRRLLGAADGVS